MVVMINTFSFSSDNFDFMEIRRVADEGTGCMHVLIKTSNTGGQSINLNLNLDTQDEAISIYLDVIRQLTAAKGRPIAEQVLTALEHSLRQNTSLSLGGVRSDGNNPTPGVDCRPTGNTRENEEESASQPLTPSDPHSYPIPPNVGVHHCRCVSCNAEFDSPILGLKTCLRCAAAIQGVSHETGRSEEAAQASSQDDSEGSGERDEAGPSNFVSSIPLPDETDEGSAQRVKDSSPSDREGDQPKDIEASQEEAGPKE